MAEKEHNINRLVGRESLSDLHLELVSGLPVFKGEKKTIIIEL